MFHRLRNKEPHQVLYGLTNNELGINSRKITKQRRTREVKTRAKAHLHHRRKPVVRSPRQHHYIGCDDETEEVCRPLRIGCVRLVAVLLGNHSELRCPPAAPAAPDTAEIAGRNVGKQGILLTPNTRKHARIGGQSAHIG